MNERILELAKQADPDQWHKRWYSGINPRVMDPEIKKFVELIVRECATLANDCPSDYLLKPGRYPSTWIKQHFGVLE